MVTMNQIDANELDERFCPPPIDGNPQVFAEQVEPKFKDIAAMLIDNLNDSRERSLAMTKLEEAYHWTLMATRHMPNVDLPDLFDSKKQEAHLMSEEDRNVVRLAVVMLDFIGCMFHDKNELSTASGIRTIKDKLEDVWKRM